MVLKEKPPKTEISIKWFYPSYAAFKSLSGDTEYLILEQSEKEERHKTERLFEEFKNRIKAIELPEVELEKKVKEKEIIREKEVIVKVRCSSPFVTIFMLKTWINVHIAGQNMLNN